MGRAKEQVTLDADGLPLPLKWKPVVRWGSLVFGLLFGVGLQILLQQYGVAPVTTMSLLLWVAIGVLTGILVPSIAYAFAIAHANRSIARTRKNRTATGGANP